MPAADPSEVFAASMREAMEHPAFRGYVVDRALELQHGAEAQAEHFLAQRERLRDLLARALAWLPQAAQDLKSEVARELSGMNAESNKSPGP